MKIQKILRKAVVLATVFTIAITSVIPLSQNVFASEEYRLELFNQLSDKVTSLYYKEAIVGLEVLDEVYGDPELLKNIEKHLNKDEKTKNYLLERGFNENKINEILDFIHNAFPSIEYMKSDKDKNIIKRLIKTTLVEENKTLSFSDYDEDIKQFAKDLYEILPSGVSDAFDIYFETTEEKIDAITKILIEFLYSGHGKGIYNKNTNEYIDLKLVIDDSFIDNVNKSIGVKILNESSKKSMNIFLAALEDSLKSKELDRVYSDLSIVLNLVDANGEPEKREENIPEVSRFRHIEEKDVTRAEILKLTLGALGLEPTEYKGEFTDVKSDDFYSGYIAKAKSIGIINGYKDNTFKPSSKVTISETMNIISNAIEYLNGSKKLSQAEIDNALKDIKHKDKIQNWARESVAKLVIVGVIESDYNGEFERDTVVTREEAIKLIDKILH